tara:strand:- start:3 stop:482 length:480 start_codon:yes stop_codon:yes gene_type:complete
MPTLYLLRHGDAVPDQENLLRPLSDQGKEEVRSTATQAKTYGINFDKVLHSTKVRAKQSAEIFCETLGLDVPLQESPHILPMSEPEPMLELCNETSGGLLIVTHLPFVNRLASLLIGGKEDAEQFTFKTASLLCLTQRSGSDLLGPEGQWAVEHYISRP